MEYQNVTRSFLEKNSKYNSLDTELRINVAEFKSFCRLINKDFNQLNKEELKELLIYLNISTLGNSNIQRKKLLSFLKSSMDNGIDFIEIVKIKDSLGIDIPKFCKYEILMDSSYLSKLASSTPSSSQFDENSNPSYNLSSSETQKKSKKRSEENFDEKVKKKCRIYNTEGLNIDRIITMQKSNIF